MLHDIIQLTETGVVMIRKMIVAAAVLLAFPALADDTGKKIVSDMLEEAAVPYVTCVMTELDRLSETERPRAGEDADNFGRRWADIVSGKCKTLFAAQMREVRAIYGDEIRPPVYSRAVATAMSNMIDTQAAMVHWQWATGENILTGKGVSEKKPEQWLIIR